MLQRAGLPCLLERQRVRSLLSQTDKQITFLGYYNGHGAGGPCSGSILPIIINMNGFEIVLRTFMRLCGVVCGCGGYYLPVTCLSSLILQLASFILQSPSCSNGIGAWPLSYQ